MTKLLPILLLITLTCTGATDNRFTYRFEELSVNQGLAQHDVSSIVQDKYGFIWIATYNGLHRYDGYNFRIFRYDAQDSKSIKDNRILSIFVDSKSRLWIATEGGGLNLYNYENENFTGFRLGNNLTDNNIYSIHEDTAGYLWLGAANGLYRVTFNSAVSVDIQKIDCRGTVVNNVKRVGGDTSGNIFISTPNEVFRLNRGSTCITANDRILAGQATDIVHQQDDRMLLGTANGLLLYDSSTDALLEIKQAGRQLKGVCSISSDKSGRFYVATERGSIYALTPAGDRYEIEQLNIESGNSSQPIVKALFVDNMQNLWVGTGNNGVRRINLLSKRFYRIFNGENDGDTFVKTIFKDSRANMWLQTEQHPLAVYSSADGNVAKQISLPNIRVLGLSEDKLGRIWGCDESNIYIFEYTSGNTIKVKKFDIPRDSPLQHIGIRTIACDSKDNVWVGSWSGVLQIKGATSKSPTLLFHNNFGLSHDNIGIITIYCQKEASRVWMCSRDYGLIMLDTDAQGEVSGIKHFNIDAEVPLRINSNHVWAVSSGSAGTIWVGTDAGLNSITFENGSPTVSNYRHIRRIGDDKILAIIHDRSQNIWMNTSVGLVRFTPDTNHFSEYFKRDGLSSSALTESSIIDNSGTIFVGSINGVTYFNPDEIADNPYVPNVLLSGLSVFNREVKVGERVKNHVILNASLLETNNITLKHNHNNFSFEFVALHFSYPKQNLYAHKLEGYDKDWIYSTGANRTASYNNLPSGEYQFMVKAANSDGVWNDNPLATRIVVRSAPWVTWWAYLLYTLTFVTILYIITRVYLRNQALTNKLYLEQVEHQNDIMLNEERMKFHANITHELRTPLTLIIAPLDELLERNYDEYTSSRLALIRKNCERLKNLVNQFLDLKRLDKESMPLKVKEQEIALTISAICESFEHYAQQYHIELSIVNEISTRKGWVDCEMITKIISNLLSNAIKFTPKGGRVTIFISTEGDMLRISVEDTGCGISKESQAKIFDRFYQCNESNFSQGTGIGLSLVKKLTTLHHGDIKVLSTPGQGSTFTVSIPINREEYAPHEGDTPQPSASEESTNYNKDDSKPIVLVVDDDDDMRNYLCSCLMDKYNVIAENNAQSGLDVAINTVPDLIITDIMMPGMSGFELSEKLKSDFRTSHIPIVILTAKYSDEDITKGYSTGAENYITKPFNRNQLLLKLRNIITFRNQRIVSDVSKTPLDPKPKLNEREQRFIDRLTEFVNANIDNAEYNVEDMCREVGTSRMQLHRKLTALIGKTTSEFIRDIRMTRARELLESGNYNVSETMYQVGIRSNSHFTKAFKETFGMTPSELMRKTR